MNTSKHILFHIDGDAFFASCETATNMRLRGLPIAVGRERGVATALSYEAKALGVTRGMKGYEIQREYPEVRLISSDYRKYGLFSERFKRIVKTYTTQVEGMSIDECYADMTDVVSDFDQARRMAVIMQNELRTKLGMTFSIGIGPNKTIAKIASGMNKPHGITIITPDTIEECLHHKSVGVVSGIGFRSEGGLHKSNIYTIGDLLSQSVGWVEDNLSKPYREIYRELTGEFVKHLELVQSSPKSISKIRAFAPATNNKDYLRSEFSRNAEIVAHKMQSLDLQGHTLVLGMKLPRIPNKSQGGSYFVHTELSPGKPIRHTQDILTLINQHFDELYESGCLYRATYVAVHKLTTSSGQLDLFGEHNRQDTHKDLGLVRNKLEKKYGRGVLHRASSLGSITQDKQNKQKQTHADYEGTPLILAREQSKVLYLPYLGVFT